LRRPLEASKGGRSLGVGVNRFLGSGFRVLGPGRSLRISGVGSKLLHKLTISVNLCSNFDRYGFRVLGFGRSLGVGVNRFLGSGFRVSRSGFRVLGSGRSLGVGVKRFLRSGSGFRVSRSGFRLLGSGRTLGIRVSGFEIRFAGSGFRVPLGCEQVVLEGETFHGIKPPFGVVTGC